MSFPPRASLLKNQEWRKTRPVYISYEPRKPTYTQQPRKSRATAVEFCFHAKRFYTTGTAVHLLNSGVDLPTIAH